MATATLARPAVGAEFLAWLEGWYRQLPAASFEADILQPAGGPDRVALISVDLIVGFCSEGPLASPRVGAVVPGVRDLFLRAWNLGLRHFLYAQDAHPPDSPEFRAFGPHCIAGTREAETVPELANLPFVDQITLLPKRSLNFALGTGWGEWLAARPQLRSFIIVGDCTDLCVYQAAMQLRLQANAENRDWEVIVPAAHVDTYDVPVAKAQEQGILPHDAELLHRLFLYHMALNGIRVVRRLT